MCLQQQLVLLVVQAKVERDGVARDGSQFTGHPRGGGAQPGVVEASDAGGDERPSLRGVFGQCGRVEGGVEDGRVQEVAGGGPVGQSREARGAGAPARVQAPEGGAVVDAQGAEGGVDRRQVRLLRAPCAQFGERRARVGGGCGRGEGDASADVVLPACAGSAAGRRGDGEVPDAVGGGAQDQLQQGRPGLVQAQRPDEPDVGEPYVAGVPHGGRGLQRHGEEGGARQPCLTGDPVVAQIGEAAVAQVHLGLEEVPVGLVAGLDVCSEQG